MLTARPRGFTLIELMTGIALFAILMMLAMPTFTSMLQNGRLRATGESILAGLQIARTEALRRNQKVEFMLLAANPDPANVTGFAANATGPSWAVRALDAAGNPDPNGFVEGRSGLQGSGQSDPALLYAQMSASNMPGTNTIQFDALGRTNVGAAPATFDVTPADASACKANGGEMRCMRVVVSPGGRVRMCDPSVDPVASPNDTRAC
jgi:type IV fimbrial biogenesis protein FimT